MKKLTTKFLWVQRELLLFNDMLVLTERRGKKLLVKLAASYTNFRVETAPTTVAQKYCLNFMYLSPEKKLTLAFPSYQLMETCLRLIQECLLALPSVVPLANNNEKEAWEKLVSQSKLVQNL